MLRVLSPQAHGAVKRASQTYEFSVQLLSLSAG
jgi:hypothetical protein